MTDSLTPCVFFDRDGIVNVAPVETRYVETWESFRLQDGFGDVLAAVIDMGYEAVIATNQRGIATGALKRENVEEIHSRLREQLAYEYGVSLLDIMCCPHDNDSCTCRKPQPGLLLEAAQRHQLDLSRSWMIGDKPTDMAAGKSAGCRTILVGEESSDLADFSFKTMPELHSRIAQLLSIG